MAAQFSLKEILKTIEKFETEAPEVKHTSEVGTSVKALDRRIMLMRLAPCYFLLKEIAEEALAQMPGKDQAIIVIKPN